MNKYNIKQKYIFKKTKPTLFTESSKTTSKTLWNCVAVRELLGIPFITLKQTIKYWIFTENLIENLNSYPTIIEKLWVSKT